MAIRHICFIFFLVVSVSLQAQDSLSIPSNTIANQSDQSSENLYLSFIEIADEVIDFKKLSDTEYRNSISHGDILHGSYDSLTSHFGNPIGLKLPHYLNTLTFHFSAIEWGAPHKIRYSYRIKEDDEEWSAASFSAEVNFSDLRPGHHTLEVKAIGASQIWSEPIEYSFFINKPWWFTWWAYLGYFLVASFLIFIIYKYWNQRQHEIKEIHRLLQENKLLVLSNSVENIPVGKQGGFLQQVGQILESHLSDENFGIAELCQTMNISRTQLHRKLKKLTGQSTSHYIRSLRLEIAKGLLDKTTLNISEVAFSVGFSSATYFSKVFKEKYGVAPREFR